MIILGFPGTGKSFLVTKTKAEESKVSPEIIDFETVKYHQQTTVEDSDTQEILYDLGDLTEDNKQPSEFVTSFVDEIIENDNDDVILLCPSHVGVIRELKSRDVDFVVVLPTKTEKDEYLDRYRRRGNGDSYIHIMDNDFETYIDTIMDINAELFFIADGETMEDALRLLKLI